MLVFPEGVHGLLLLSEAVYSIEEATDAVPGVVVKMACTGEGPWRGSRMLRPALRKGVVIMAKGMLRLLAIAGLTLGLTSTLTAAALPPLKVVFPVNGAAVRSPLSVVFETPADLSKMTMGAHMVEMTAPHLHIALDKRVTMPPMKQLVRLGPHRYRFALGRVKPGRHTIRVYWADAMEHKPMGAVQVVTVTVK